MKQLLASCAVPSVAVLASGVRGTWTVLIYRGNGCTKPPLASCTELSVVVLASGVKGTCLNAPQG